MNRAFAFSSGVTLISVIAAFAACGSESANQSSTEPDASNTPDSGPPPVPSPYGLDSRPSNTTCLAKARPPAAGLIELEDAFPKLPNINRLVYFGQPPGDASRFIVIEQGGAIRSFANDPNVSSLETVLQFPSGVVHTGAGEGGLLGLAFHPDWQTNFTAFVSYTVGPPPNGVNESRITRIKSTDGGKTLNIGTEETILTQSQPFENHNGGQIDFGPDGNLYIGFGDGGSGGDPMGNAQNPNTLLGKMLRISVGASGAYTIPDGNPYKNGGGKAEIFASGLRNPWRWSFDRTTGDLWAGDVGQNVYEEVDQVNLGGNYGWKTREGFHCYNASTCETAGFIDPIVEYKHENGNVSITGGYVYRGKNMPEFVGTYFFADYNSGRIWSIVYDEKGKASSKLMLETGFNISSFGEDANGELYVLNYGKRPMRLRRTGESAPDTFPKLLSQTGCVDSANPKVVSSGLIPYDVISPLWSDGAEKHRWIGLPDGQTITLKSDGDFEFPNGTVLVKEFRLGGKRIETRLFMKHDDGEWGGYSYEWNDAETDATLLPAGKSKTIGAQVWTYPSRTQCLSCHTEAAGRTLGLELRQLNHDAIYASTNRLSNELRTLEHIGVFAAPLGDIAALPALADPFGSDPVAARARSYLHSNCSHCHRPDGPGQGTANFLATTAEKDLGVCNAEPTAGNLGISGAKLLAPGDPAKSILSVRVHANGANRMPPVGSNVVHTEGAALLDSWIQSVTTCPN